MLSQMSREYPQVPMMPSSRHPVAVPPQPHWRLSWSLLVLTAQHWLSIIGRPIGWPKQAGDWEGPVAARFPTGNIQSEIMRIEARRRI